MKRLVVMVSGNGSNLQALIDACVAGQLSARIVSVVSNRLSAYALERARHYNITTHYFPLKPYRDANLSRTQYDTDLADLVAGDAPDLIVLAGWMHVLSGAFLDRFKGRVVNLHPALPGEFAGTNAIQRAFEAFSRGEVTSTGCMVHYVVPEVDAGPVIATAHVPIYETDSLDDLESRMHTAEHRLIVEAVAVALQS